MNMKKYDDILIGSGPAAYKMANLLAKTDHKVLVIEGFEYGGTCPNYGCEPKIFLEGAARTVLQSQQLLGRGIGQPAKLDWEALMQTKLKRFDPWPDETRNIIKKNHDIEDGYASFVDNHTITVNGHQYQANHIIIATGQTPNILDIPGKEYLHTSYDLLSLKELPQRIMIIGAGFVGLELATLVAAAGAEVTIVVHSDRVLREFTKTEDEALVNAMQQRGIKFSFNTDTQKVSQGKDGLLVTTDHGEIRTDYVLDATGRHPNIEKLALENTDIEYDRHGINVDGHLMTTVDGVYAIGDVVNRKQPKLTPVAEFEGQYLFDYLTGKTNQDIVYPTIGQAAFTFPEVARAGVNPDDVVNDSNYQIKKVSLKYGSLYAGQNDQISTLTLIFKDQQLVGASEIGDYATDDINNFLPIIGLKINGKEYRQKVMAIYPTLGDKVAGLLP
ncbi:pyridine nucleotide-disulfide oxidoreductase [Limosilactobacillus reuteri]|uniref:Pyridine nucleotide-disulfide oxidoreductase n=1 Tax=Limosilactobacillus reuteri TaxID=1598 RepID=A0AB73PJH2_LIMRT|nr:NAD(P)/FAD-dependent oxidoreductase [Limosilactobacillus reuteri]OYS49746.1 pyridine nucleotide-disulfide oxidoreductase [Limosilactobacillus reuteri]OYS55486.1 pyridine nucleotide-disulfide oxidoreductase [Limosilactobacillus reuteri]OYS87298.1 pyridine nucleotide-disulfide oxidoreductase [Limosilactobacillus reuteri]OYS90098.1 pyridine nucleotide-disulfide oxidoreductase [Limosilactobacillus reuteri]OYS93300.1 pyridine nucleotide-disulfide oxidoreductase [Limosilactobacillus reuteri]